MDQRTKYKLKSKTLKITYGKIHPIRTISTNKRSRKGKLWK